MVNICCKYIKDTVELLSFKHLQILPEIHPFARRFNLIYEDT